MLKGSKLQRKKAQVGNEALFAVGVVLLLFILILPIIIDKKKEVDVARVFIEKNNDCNGFANILARVSAKENLNVTHYFSYAIKMRAGERTIDTENVFCNSFVNLSEELNLQKGDVEVRNVNGGIIVKNV